MLIRILSLFLITLSAHAAINDAAAKVEWGYTGNKGPAYWAKLSPDFALCATGKRQSPIDVPSKQQTIAGNLTISYQPSPTWIVHDGETSFLLGDQQTLIRDGHGVRLNFHDAGPAETVVYNGETYRLLQFHFHTPSENKMHRHGYPMEIHFVHQGPNGKLLVIGVLVKKGKPNPYLQMIVDHLPNDHGVDHEITSQRIDPINLLPANKKYYGFNGSLTTPPCGEGVQWVVMADTITASQAQIKALRKAMGGANARPVQALNGRQIYISKHEG